MFFSVSTYIQSSAELLITVCAHARLVCGLIGSCSMQRIVTSSKAKKVLGKPRKGTDSDSVQAKAKVEKLPVCVCVGGVVFSDLVQKSTGKKHLHGKMR